MPIEGLYVDQDNASNKYRYHNPVPKFMMGINSSVRYRNFDFYFSGRLNIDNYVYNNRASGTTYSGLYVNQFFNNTSGYIYESEFVNPQYWSDMYVENASFFKMDNMSLGYNTDLMQSKLKARFSLTAQNAFMITNYGGLDPEVDGGIDNNIYPRPRTFVVGINLTY
jgi:iron complex outermembrane receptor protein